MTTSEQMKTVTKNAQEALGRLQALISIPGFWTEFQDHFHAALRFGNSASVTADKQEAEIAKLMGLLEQAKATVAKSQERSAALQQEAKEVSALRHEVETLKSTIESYRDHPAVKEAELKKTQAEIAETERRLLALKVVAAEKAKALSPTQGEG